ncbi:bifunctional phosphopantothenoylcysteine decarboxylase/phosphopantothenate--cysteine ligase CoaBC [candidate division bacterium WOR-3 4484_18]|uniref:Coenzyme A biosynthesis bifunctional protein CoaBC n=1 Tax=candidate division WOR-3 bacterium 4484_18 TaxID=2020626 RepID=A0A257LUN3_UNCW3|nr:MAG: bifunctional phosphopantothenoylcysteine decarboxylase/phosphopantothenate--cysteine ligase CoaBC [candidate division bacterium WOR-3 4484_18]
MEREKKGEVILGITASIAAYKGLEVVRLLRKEGYDVKVILTPDAKQFVSPLVAGVLSNNEVYSEFFVPQTVPIHVKLTDADLVLVAPASYDFINKVAAGIADNVLLATVATTRAPVVLAPAMEERLWENKVLQENIRKLSEVMGYKIIEPEEGELASGKIGKGRMRNPEEIVRFVKEILDKKSLAGRTIVVTAGPTREYIDAVRFISNPASGKMGYTIAEEVRDRGGHVILVSGPTGLEKPIGVETVQVESTEEMLNAVIENLEKGTALIMCAAPTDFRPVKRYEKKFKKDVKFEPKFEPTPDVLEITRKRYPDKIMVGFALETEFMVWNGVEKLKKKGLDMIVVNNPKTFGRDDIEAIIVDRELEIWDIGRTSKRKLGKIIVDKVENFLFFDEN